MHDQRLLEQQILKEQVKQLYAFAPLGLLATLLNSSIVFFVMIEVLSQRVLLTWIVSIWTITALRSLLLISFRRQAPERLDPAKWGGWFRGGLFLSGVAWGSLGVFCFSFSMAHQVFIAFVLGGMAAGASSAFSQVRLSYTSFSIPALAPLALHFLLLPDLFHHAMAAMTIVYLVMLWKISQYNYSINRTSLLLRFENAENIASLRRANNEVEALNAQLIEEIKGKREAEAELRLHRDHLEKTVEERTSDLLAANERLQDAQEELLVAKELAEAGSRAKSEFLANMSHEMRTPLAGVLGMIRLVLDLKIGEEERNLLEMAKRSAESLLRIIGDVLDFSRMEAGVMKFERKRFSVPETVRSAVEVVYLSAVEKGLELSWKAEESVREMEGDEGRLRQVLVNLLGNAVKFTQKGRIELTVRTFQDPEAKGGRFLLFSVLDTGIGIPADQLEKIFGKFSQIDSSLTRKHGGTGLGLALSRQIVEKLGGRIWAESAEGVGSTFHFTLPIQQLQSLSTEKPV